MKLEKLVTFAALLVALSLLAGNGAFAADTVKVGYENAR